jgi:phage baseplate assembly protein W
MATYFGFSTYNRAKKFKLTDFELVKQDLFNHFHIRKGEKLMQPNFGTIVWNVLFEPFTEEIKNLIVDDVQKVIDYDPRINAEQVKVIEYTNGIQIEIDLKYVLDDRSSQLVMQFDRNSGLLTGY